MHHYVLAASCLTPADHKLSEDAYYEALGVVPFAGLRKAIRWVVRTLRGLRARRATARSLRYRRVL